MMTMTLLRIARYAFGGALIVSILSTTCVVGQGLSKTEFSSAASQIASQTDNSYRLLRLGSNKSPAILTVDHTASTRILLESARNDTNAVRHFARHQAQYLAENALGLTKNAVLAETGTARTGNLWLSSFTVSYGGIRLRERYLRMNIGALSGEVMLIRNNIPSKLPNTIMPNIAQDEIIRQTTNLLGIHFELKSSPRLVFVDEKENSSLRLCYELTATEPDMNEMWRLTFDAVTAELIEKRSLLEHECFSGEEIANSFLNLQNDIIQPSYYCYPLNGVGGMVLAKVHLHSPYDTLTTVGLPYVQLIVNGISVDTDSNGFWTLPSSQYPLTIGTSFDSKFFSVLREDNKPNSILTKTIPNGRADVLWDDSNSATTERDAYYSTAFAHLADKRIDTKLTGIDLHMKVNINYSSSCNSFYSLEDTSLNFFSASSECSNTAQIADVVFHEYGHRVTNARYTKAAGQDADIVDGSLGEGFADLNSVFIRDDPRIGIGFFGNDNKILRTCDNTKIWPRDIDPDIHISGEIISGAFWDLRKTIGRDTAEHLFHFMEYQMPDGINITDSASLEDAFTNTLWAVILTDDDDNNLSNGTPHLHQILSAFKLHNITLPNSIDLVKTGSYDTSVTSYKISPYPNPVHRGEKLYFSHEGVSSVSLVDFLGRVVLKFDNSDGSLKVPSSIAPGIYFIEGLAYRYKIVVAE